MPFTTQLHMPGLMNLAARFGPENRAGPMLEHRRRPTGPVTESGATAATRRWQLSSGMPARHLGCDSNRQGPRAVREVDHAPTKEAESSTGSFILLRHEFVKNGVLTSDLCRRRDGRRGVPPRGAVDSAFARPRPPVAVDGTVRRAELAVTAIVAAYS